MIVGIDPGLEGAIVGRMPDHSIAVTMPLKEGAREISYDGLLNVLSALREHGIVHVFLERAMPMAMGAKHAFNYGRGFAAVEIAIATLKLPVTYVEPTKWMKLMFEGVDSRLKPKERALIAFERLCSEVQEIVPKNKKGKLHSGVVDAVLIAEYGMRVLGSQCATAKL